MRLILQGIRAETHLAALQRLLRDPATERIILSVAYLRSTGLDLLVPDLTARADRIRVFAGVRNGITSRQGLQQLLATGVQLFAVDTGTTSVTYHPKLYLASSTTVACLIVGSANLTVGGLNNNIEASLEVQLDLNNPSDLDFYRTTARLFDDLPAAHPHNVFRITTQTEIDRLSRTGLLIDEHSAPQVPVYGSQPTDAVPRIQLAVPPHRTPTIPAQPARRPRTRRTTAARDATDPWGAGTPPWTAGTWERVWTSKALTERDLNIPTGATTHVTGSINLDKGLLPATTDHRHYFRDTVFSGLTWTSTNRGTEEAVAIFHLVVSGIYHGDFALTLSHSTSTTNRTYTQRNAMTRLRWGQARTFVAHRHLLQRALSLLRDRMDPGRFLIEID